MSRREILVRRAVDRPPTSGARDTAICGLRKRSLTTRAAASLVLATAALVGSAGPAGAHGGDTNKVHSCIVPSSGYAQLIGPNETCSKNYQAQDWPGIDTNTTYRAGSGLSLSSDNVFSVTGAPWGGLSGVPTGFADGQDDVGDAWGGLSGVPARFADGEDDVGASLDMKRDDQSAPKEPNDDDGFVHWNNLEGVPTDLADGLDDDGSARVRQLRDDLDGAPDDTTPNESNDLVSLNEIKDLTAGGDGRITGEFLKNGSITGDDIDRGTITASNLAGSYDDSGREVVVGAVTGSKIADGSIEARDLARGLIDRSVSTVGVNPEAVRPGDRIAVKVRDPLLASLKTDDIVTVSPPEDLERGLLFAGSDVLTDGELTIYLHNVSPFDVDGAERAWKVRRLKVAP